MSAHAARAPRKPVLVRAHPQQDDAGDAALNDVGAIAATWISGAFVNASIGRVVPAADVTRLLSASPETGGEALARQLNAGLLVRGRYQREGVKLAFSAQLVNVASGKVLATSGPAVGQADSLVAYTALYNDLATAIDLRRVWGEQMMFWPRPRECMTWRTYLEAQQVFFARGHWAAALPGFRRAQAMEPGWVLPSYGIWVAYGNIGNRRPAMDSLEEVVRPMMTGAPGPLKDTFDWISASHRGDKEGMYQTARRVYANDPVGQSYTLALPATRAGRFAEVIQLFNARDTSEAWVNDWRAWDGQALAAMHLLGRHDDELALARENIQRRGYDWGTALWEITALGSLGRMTELDAALARYAKLPETQSNTLSGALNVAAMELEAHGDKAKAMPYFERRLDYYLAFPPEKQRTFAAAMANAYGQVGTHKESLSRYDSLSRANPANIQLLAMTGVIAAQLKDKAKLAEVDAKLVAEARPEMEDLALYWRSFIAAQTASACAAPASWRSASRRAILHRARWEFLSRTSGPALRSAA